MLEHILDLELVLVLELYLELEMEMVHIPVPPGPSLLLVQITCSFIPGQIMGKNEDEDTGRNTGHFQSISK